MSAPKGAFGAVLAVTSALCFTIMAMAAKAAYEDGASAAFVVILRSGATVIALAAVQVAMGGGLRMLRGARWPLLAYAVGTAGVALGYIGSLAFIPASQAVLLFYMFPVMTVMVSAARERRAPSMLNIAAAAAAFAGLFLVFDTGAETLDWRGAALGLLAAGGSTLLFHAAPALIRAGGSTAAVFTGAFWTFPIVAAAGLTFGEFTPPENTQTWWILGGGVIIFSAGLATHMAAVRIGGVDRTAILFNVEPLFVMALAIILFGESLSSGQWAGAALVMSAVMTVALKPRRRRGGAENQADSDSGASKP
ncbi:MAG: DMT family transporter [Rhodospirillales bacterium]